MDNHEGFKVGKEQLTAQGMRQRYLLGAYNGRRYSEEYDLIDLENGEEQILMMSTIVNRTMQSGYSELMGMFHHQRRAQLTMEQEKVLNHGEVASPPFQVRDQHDMITRLGRHPLPDGFNPVPIFNHNEVSMTDDLDLTGCNYVNEVDGDRFPSESTYTNVEFLKDDLRQPFTEAFNLNQTQSEDMSFMNLYGYCDVVQSRLFEFELFANHTLGYNYTPD